MTYLFAEAPEDITQLGGKGLSLVKMTKAGFVVPDGFVISADVQKRTEDFDKEVLSAFDQLGAKYVAVRSSAVAEDGANTAWAGQLETYLNIARDDLLQAIEDCWRSINSDRAKSYAKQHNIEAGAVAVVVQKMIQSDVSGIAFSAHPVTGDKNQVVIEAGLGLGEAIVSGTITPDTYVINKQTDEIVESFPATQTKKLVLNNGANQYQEIEPMSQQKITNEQIKEVAEQTKKLEEYYRHPVDVEWAIEKDQLYITQCRPITTLS